MRESPSLELISLLNAAGADVSYHDPHVPQFKDGHRKLEMTSVALEPAKYDCVVIATDHTSIDYPQLVADAELVVDLRNATKRIESDKVWKL
jgi:UDP-N-acetyl-D-glucosamine dehydrogenase